MSKAEIHKSICENLNNTYKAKNADYGDSFAKVRKEYPEAICVRLMDKLERLKTLCAGNTQQVADESIEDTLLDLANYCIMEVVERRAETPEVFDCSTCGNRKNGLCPVGMNCIFTKLADGRMSVPSHWKPKEGAVNE